MHIVTADVMSANGKINKGTNVPAHTWASAEDWQEFQKLRDTFEVIVMGRNTYESMQPAPQPGLLRAVLTHHADSYRTVEVPGQLEFLAASPQELIQLLELRGFSRVLLVGGQVNSAFWKAGLVDEAFITIEPLLFGPGAHLAEMPGVQASLRLQSTKQLNERGTTQLHYLVDRSSAYPLS